MTKIYHLSRSGSKIIHKMKHRRGHGIHSPFVFYLTTRVIQEKAAYYAYDDIHQFLKEHNYRGKKSEKANKLIFRLINYWGAKNILSIGSNNGIIPLYLTAPSENIICNSIEFSPKSKLIAAHLYKDWKRDIRIWENNLPILTQKQDCILVDFNGYNFDQLNLQHYLLSNVTENSFLILKGLRTNKACQTLWKNIKASDEVGITLDLFDLGVVFLDKKYHKRNYKINS